MRKFREGGCVARCGQSAQCDWPVRLERSPSFGKRSLPRLPSRLAERPASGRPRWLPPERSQNRDRLTELPSGATRVLWVCERGFLGWAPSGTLRKSSEGRREGLASFAPLLSESFSRGKKPRTHGAYRNF